MTGGKRKAFTLIEMLVVVMILGILVTIALPSYISSIKDAREKTANANARCVMAAIQTLYVKVAGKAYNDAGISHANIAQELGGKVPKNPCTGGNDLVVDYQLNQTITSVSVEAAEGEGCDPDKLPKFQRFGA
jgi:prepilin-type N-terminal cleavage/methylation domain-containing protein